MMIRGRIARVVRDPKLNPTGWCVLHVALPGTREPATVTGCFSRAAIDRHIIADGDWRQHDKYGPQFRADRITETIAPAAGSLSGYILECMPELGRKWADKLASALPPQRLLSCLDGGDVDAMTQLGVKIGHAHALIGRWHRRREYDRLLGDCHAMGLSVEVITQIQARVRSVRDVRALVNQVRVDPFAIADYVDNSFTLLEPAARARGVRPSVQRTDAALRYVMQAAAGHGHCFVATPHAVDRALGLCNRDLDKRLHTPATMIYQRIAHLIADQHLAQHETEDGSTIALADIAQAEYRIGQRLRALASTPARINPMSAEQAARKSVHTLTGDQHLGLGMALSQKLAVLTGGPGTGKTALMNLIVAAFPEHARIALLAPTGQASKRLAESTQRDTRTIHFAIADEKRGRPTLSEADLVVVDEGSMIDVPLTDEMLSYLPNDARLLIVGDPEQLPSVGVGAVLRDLIDSDIAHTHLSEVVRVAEDSGINRMAKGIRNGVSPFRVRVPANDTKLLRVTDDAECARALVSAVGRLRKHGVPPGDIQILVPWRHGRVGTRRLNVALRRSLIDPPRGATSTQSPVPIRDSDAWVGDRVRYLENDYERGLTNGTIGRVIGHSRHPARVIAEFEGIEHRFDPNDAQRLQLDYAATVHRSQGSQYPVVVLGIAPEHLHMIDRRMIYTGVTRSSSLFVAVANSRTLDTAVQISPQDARQTRLSEFLKDMPQLDTASTPAMEITHAP